MMGGSGNDLVGQDGPKPLGVRAERVATHEFGRPVPYFAGYGQFGGTFISEVWGVRSVQVKKKIGKKSQVVGYNYYCSFAMVLCLGPVDRVEQIWMDDELFWEGSVTRGATDYADITVTGFGTVRLYWGTETQTEDGDLQDSGFPHPAYRGVCYAVFKDWLLGYNRTSVQNFEFVLQRTPAISWMSATQNIEDDANPISVLVEVLTSPRYGLGLAEDRLDTDSLNTAAVALHSEGIGISPYVAKGGSFSQFVGKLLDHIDGFLVSQGNGLLGLQLIRTWDGDTPHFDETEITETPLIESFLWWDTINEVAVKYNNRERYFETDSVSYRDRASFAIVGSTRSQSIQRDWVTRQSVAWRIAAAVSRQLSLPHVEGTVRVKRSAMTGVDVGTVIKLSYAQANLTELQVRVRSISIERPESPTASIRFSEERGYLNEDFFVPEDFDFGSATTYKAEALYAQDVFEIPFGWSRVSEMIIGLRPTRNDVVSNGFVGWWERTPGSYTSVEDSDVFWMSGATNGAFDIDELLESDTELDVTFGGTDKTLDPTTYDEAVSSPSQWLFIGDEIMIPYAISLVSAGRYTMKVLRARYGTQREQHNAGKTVKVVQLGTAQDIGSHEFESPVTTTQKYKLQPYFMGNGIALADCPVITLTPRSVALAPIPPANVTVNGDGYTPTYGTGTDLLVDWDETNELRDLRPPEEILTSRAQFTLLQILTTGGTVKGTIRVTGAVGPYTITNAALVALLGAQTSFKLRTRYEFAGVASLTYVETTVTKV